MGMLAVANEPSPEPIPELGSMEELPPPAPVAKAPVAVAEASRCPERMLRIPAGSEDEDEVGIHAASETGKVGVLAASGEFFRCKSPYGVFDMSRNAAEWTEEKVVKGGSFSCPDVGVRCASRNLRGTATAEIGFRCCADLK